jgi:hypothetical protein
MLSELCNPQKYVTATNPNLSISLEKPRVNGVRLEKLEASVPSVPIIMTPPDSSML